VTHGFQINRADGTEEVGLNNTSLRHRASETFAFNAAETRSIPDVFNDNFIVQIVRHTSKSLGAYNINVIDFPSVTVSEASDTITVSPPATDLGFYESDYTVLVMGFG
jgi:hypothetical protein